MSAIVQVLKSRGVFLAAVCIGCGATSLFGQSPFIPAGTAPTEASTQPDPQLLALQLTGISVIGDDQRFNLMDARSKKAFWIALKETHEGFTLESYDLASDTVVVRKGGETRRLELRQSKIAVMATPSAAPVVVAGGDPAPGVQREGVDEIKNPQTPTQVKQAEFEARMLVSDLLEISMQERARQKALREQQARAN